MFALSSCVRALAKYSGETDHSAIWSVTRTREIHETIGWPDLAAIPESERWLVASARAFLRVCAEQGYGIQFDP